MAVYYILILAPMMIQHFSIGRKNINYEKKNHWTMLLFFVGLAFLLALRHRSVGSDTVVYINAFKRISDMSWGKIASGNGEIGFMYYTKVLSRISSNPQIFLAVTALITCALVYPTYKRLCLDPSLTIVLFGIMSTFVMMFSGIRQMLAIGIGFVAYEYVRKKKWVSFILMVFLAMSFHTSAFILAFMYPLYHARITKKWLYAVIPGLVLMFIFNKQMFLFLGVILERFTHYDTSIVKTGAYTMLILFAIFTVFSFLVPEESCLDKETIGMRNFLLLSLIIQMFAPLHSYAMRMNYYYIIFIPLLLPKIIVCRSKRWTQVAVIGRHVMVVFFALYFFISAGNGINLNVFPYHFFWETVG